MNKSALDSPSQISEVRAPIDHRNRLFVNQKLLQILRRQGLQPMPVHINY